MKRLRTLSVAVVLVLLAAAARADRIVDQELAAFSVESPVNARSRTAQTVTAGLTGRLAQVQLPIACEAGAGNVIVEIVDLDGDVPGMTVRARATRTPAELPPASPLVFRSWDLDRPVHMTAGQRFAIVITFENGPCRVGLGDGYAGGHGYFESPTLGWFPFRGPAWEPDDHAFRTLIEEPRGEPACSVQGFGDLFFGRSTPVCRCLQDAALREFRCGLFHPSMFLFRRIPTPIRAGEPFPVKWTLVALAPMKGVVELSEVLPANFDGLEAPLTFFVDQVPVGGSITLEYKATAPKAGKFKVETILDGGRMQSVIEVVPK